MCRDWNSFIIEIETASCTCACEAWGKRLSLFAVMLCLASVIGPNKKKQKKNRVNITRCAIPGQTGQRGPVHSLASIFFGTISGTRILLPRQIKSLDSECESSGQSPAGYYSIFSRRFCLLTSYCSFISSVQTLKVSQQSKQAYFTETKPSLRGVTSLRGDDCTHWSAMCPKSIFNLSGETSRTIHFSPKCIITVKCPLNGPKVLMKVTQPLIHIRNNSSPTV